MSGIVVVPCHNEADNIAGMIAGIRQHVTEAAIMVVDDGSTDKTLAVARAAGADYLYYNPPGSQYGDGFITGLQRAYLFDVPWVIFIDAGGSYSPADLPRLCSHGAIVLGSRFMGDRITGQSFWRGLLTKFAHWVMASRIGWGSDYCGTRFIPRIFYNDVLDLCCKITSKKAHIFNPQLTWLMTKKVRTTWVPVTYHATNSTLKPWGLAEVAWHMLKFWKGGL